MTDATIGYGATFGIYNGTTYDAVAEVTAITPPSRSRDTIEATHLESPDKYKEFVAALAEAGEASIAINFVASASDVLVAAFDAETGQFEITFPNGVTMQFNGIVTGHEFGEIVADDKMSATFTVKASGKPVLAAA